MNVICEISYENVNCIGYRYSLMDSNIKLGYLNIIIDYNENTSTITDFSCIKPNNGFGSILLDFVINEMKIIQINNITLDDMSNRFRNSHNIYIKFGFNYLHDFGPEMELKIK